MGWRGTTLGGQEPPGERLRAVRARPGGGRPAAWGDDLPPGDPQDAGQHRRDVLRVIHQILIFNARCRLMDHDDGSTAGPVMAKYLS
ncbi:hypothetical protein, partial [Candidatus Frankia alpina]|uniref:hypothetical protein n=1 Tax=Candidatus Frankia alpina TaxID=2699483 RepID=UPI001967D6DA